MNKKIIPIFALALTACTLTACNGGSGSVNAKKPLIFFNRQPSNTATGEIDKTTMNFSDKTYYVGFDAAGGGKVQGDMIVDYLTKNIKTVDKDGDHKIGYVLAIGDSGHNDSKARTQGVREALGTWNGTTDPGASNTKEGKLTINGEEYTVVELASKEMKNDAGATWDASTAGNAFGGWYETYKSQDLEFVVSNNDGMAMGMLGNTSYPKGLPIFGYDANEDALASIKEGGLTGTVTQNVDAQAAGTLQLIRNMLDDVTGEDVIKKGITEVDQYGNKISAEMKYVEETKAVLALNAPIVKENVESYYNGSVVRDAGIKQTNAPKKKVLLTLYNAGDNFLSSSYKPALKYYAGLLNLDLNIVEGDGQSEGVILDKFVNLDNYDAYAINMVKTDSGSQYTDKLA